MSESPWSAYGRLPRKQENQRETQKEDPVRCVVEKVLRGREQVAHYLDDVMREFFEIRSGTTGYRPIITDALAPSARPETIEERLTRLAREAQTRRRSASPGTGVR